MVLKWLIFKGFGRSSKDSEDVQRIRKMFKGFGICSKDSERCSKDSEDVQKIRKDVQRIQKILKRFGSCGTGVCNGTEACIGMSTALKRNSFLQTFEHFLTLRSFRSAPDALKR